MSSNLTEQLDGESTETIENEIHELEQKLERAQARLKARKTVTLNGNAHESHDADPQQLTPANTPTSSGSLLHSTTHFLLLLSDSALPLSSFAFSSGLESYLAHNRLSSAASARPTHSSFDLFLPISISSYASTTLPFVLAAYRDPSRLVELDDYMDAAVVCAVGKRASTKQGRALLNIWENSFAASASLSGADQLALSSLKDYSSTRQRTSSSAGDGTGLPPVAAHLAPLFGVVAHVVGLSLHQTAYVFMLGHVKALISAAVRANLFGPFHAQRMLASSSLQGMIAAAVDREWNTESEEAGQSVPVMDLWIGRHEILYSRVFNS